MISLLITDTINIPILGKFLIILIIGGFMPLTAISFFKYMLPKKERDYQKSMDDMGIHTNKRVRDVYSPIRYLLPVAFVTTICLLAGTYFTFANSFYDKIDDSLFLTGSFFGDQNSLLIRQSLAVVAYAFLGGFVWSATNIIRRLVANDLAPNVYYSAGIRIILAVVIALVISFLIGKEGTSNLFQFKSSLMAIAFLTGMFPERFLQYIINLFKQFVNPDGLNNNELSLYRIEGISMPHKERLEEIGIDNAQNLATYSLTQLCIETPYEARTLLDWIGQAKLLCYLKEDMDKLRKIGVRSVFDLVKVRRSNTELGYLSDAAGVPMALLKNVNDQILADEGILALSRFQSGVNTPDQEIPTLPSEETIPTEMFPSEDIPILGRIDA